MHYKENLEMNQKTPKLDLTTLEYVHKKLMRDWETYSHQREDAVTDIEYRRANAKLHAVCKLEAEIMSLIWEVGDAQQEA